jgi:hypothetical protein
MTDKIYIVSCSQDLASFGMDRMRSGVEGIEEISLSLDWSKAKLVPVVAAEKVHFVEGEAKLVPIQPIRVPANAAVITSFYGVNGMGHLSCIGTTEFKRFDEDKTVDMSMFTSRIKASVMKDDLLAMVFVVPSK